MTQYAVDESFYLVHPEENGKLQRLVNQERAFLRKSKKKQTSSRQRRQAYPPTGEQSNAHASNHESGLVNCCKAIVRGFYYDKEKKRYFRATREHPGKKVMSCECRGIKEAPTRTIPSKMQVTKRTPSKSIVKHLQDRQYKSLSQTPQRNILERLSRLLKVKQTLKLDPCAHIYVSVDDFAVCRIEPDADQKRILTLFEARPSGNQVVQFHDVLNEGRGSLRLVQNMAMVKDQKITGLLWSPHEETRDLYIVSLLGYGNMSGETMIFQVTGSSQRIIGRRQVRGCTVWSNAWNKNPLYSNMISIGASKLALAIDVTTKRQVFHMKFSSDVFAQEFSWSNPLLFNGSRDGCIKTADVRVKGALWPVMCLRQGELASITCIRVLHDENYLLASGLNGSLKMWDLRARACVQNYEGHVNEIIHRLPFYVDPTDSLIFAAGQDSVTRIWSVESGELLHSIPFPDNVDKSLSSIPALYYSEEWGGPGGMMGLMYGADDSIHCYSY